MKPSYDDILDRITEPPTWWDESGVPRYCKFEPGGQPYTDESALLLIVCQHCGREFHAAVSVARFKPTMTGYLQDIGYGDPPNGCSCGVGRSMDTDTKRILEFWSRRNLERNWVRLTEFEIEIEVDQ